MSENGSAPETVGERLRRLRDERGLSQRDVASEGVSYAYISRIEHGTRTPSVKALRKLAAKLDVPPEYLETGVMPQPVLDDEQWRVVADALAAHPLAGNVSWDDGTIGSSGKRDVDLTDDERATRRRLTAALATVDAYVATRS